MMFIYFVCFLIREAQLNCDAKGFDSLKKDFRDHKLVKLSDGGMGTIYGYDDESKDNPNALKYVLKVPNLSKEGFRSIENEIDGFEKLDALIVGKNKPVFDQAMIKYHGCWTFLHTEGSQKLEFKVMILERLKTTLSDEFETISDLSLINKFKLFDNITKKLNLIHSLNVAQCDIKEENLMLDFENNAKFIDFGMAKFGNQPCQGGTPGYLAPEYYTKDIEVHPGRYSGTKMDIYSLGLVFCDILFGKDFTHKEPDPFSLNEKMNDFLVKEGNLAALFDNFECDCKIKLINEAEQLFAGMLDLDYNLRLNTKETSKYIKNIIDLLETERNRII